MEAARANPGCPQLALFGAVGPWPCGRVIRRLARVLRIGFVFQAGVVPCFHRKPLSRQELTRRWPGANWLCLTRPACLAESAPGRSAAAWTRLAGPCGLGPPATICISLAMVRDPYPDVACSFSGYHTHSEIGRQVKISGVLCVSRGSRPPCLPSPSPRIPWEMPATTVLRP